MNQVSSLKSQVSTLKSQVSTRNVNFQPACLNVLAGNRVSSLIWIFSVEP